MPLPRRVPSVLQQCLRIDLQHLRARARTAIPQPRRPALAAPLPPYPQRNHLWLERESAHRKPAPEPARSLEVRLRRPEVHNPARPPLLQRQPAPQANATFNRHRHRSPMRPLHRCQQPPPKGLPQQRRSQRPGASRSRSAPPFSRGRRRLRLPPHPALRARRHQHRQHPLLLPHRQRSPYLAHPPARRPLELPE